MTYSMLARYVTQELQEFRAFMMRFLIALAAAVLGVTAIAPVADAHPREREQDKVWRGIRQGNIMPLRVIEGRIVPVMRARGASYLGPELHGDYYRLKFMAKGRVLWIDVDARNGQVVSKSGF